MKKLLLFVACIICYASYAQFKEDQFFVYDRDWQHTTLGKAIYFLRVRQTGEKNFLWTTYRMFGPRVSEENFQDGEGNIPNGKCTYYDTKGYRDSTGEYANGLKNGRWYFFDITHTRIKEYEKGVLIKDSLFRATKDSLSIFLKQPVKDELATQTVSESAFKGGLHGWGRFLNNNFIYPQRAINAGISGTVVLQFIVDETGKVTNPEIYKSVEYSLDEEALRIINKSPDWMPASKDGKYVRSYKRQPIIYRMEID